MEIFKDNNNWNEKSIIGAVAFVIMCMVMVLDWYMWRYGVMDST